MIMINPLVVVALALLGLVFGSFAGAQVWRLRARQLHEDKQAGEAYDKKEYARLKGLLPQRNRTDRSRCLQCNHVLAWYDLIPLLSWVSTAGRCRYCKKPIGMYEPLVEVGMAALFVASYVWSPTMPTADVILLVPFTLWLIACVLMGILFIYDKKWFILPDRINYSLMAVGAAYAMSMLYILGTAGIFSLMGSVAIMAGVYGVLYVYSKGAWIGLGDVKLGVGLGLLLLEWELAFLALFLANFIGTLLVLPALATGRLNRHSEVPFGPLLILGTIIAVLAGPWLIDLFMRLTMASF